MKENKINTSTSSNIIDIINASALNRIFYIEDFAKCGTYTSLRSVMVRLEQKGILKRLARGIYMHNQACQQFSDSQLLNLVLEDFSHRYDVDYYPCGNYLLYLNGISMQLPQEIEICFQKIYPKKINFLGKYHIEIKHSSKDWIYKIKSPYIQHFFIALSSRRKCVYDIEKNHLLSILANKINKDELELYKNIIPVSLINKVLYFYH